MSRNPPAFDLLRAKLRFWAFHWGTPPDETLEVLGPRGVPTAVWQLGQLVGFELAGGVDARVWRGDVRLAADRYARNLYLVGPAPIVVPAGALPRRVRAIRYRTNKGYDGEYVYRHEFEGVRPVLALDDRGWPVLRRAGSGYRITWRGIEG